MKAALIFVLLTFVLIAVVAGRMLQRVPTGEIDREVDDEQGMNGTGKRGEADESPESDDGEATQTETGGEDSGGESERTDDTNDGNDSTTGSGSEQL